MVGIESVDQAWHVFAQVALLQEMFLADDEEGQDKMCSTTKTAREVEKSLRRRGLKDKVFVLDDQEQDGVVVFRARKRQ